MREVVPQQPVRRHQEAAEAAAEAALNRAGDAGEEPARLSPGQEPQIYSVRSERTRYREKKRKNQDIFVVTGVLS